MGCNENNSCKGSNVKVAVSRCNHKCNPPTIYTTEVLKPNCICGNNTLTQCMLMRENVKYVIKYDFTLLGEEIIVPKNCILEFDGGSLKNGTIVGQDTVFINVGDVDIWGTNLIRKGTWREHPGEGGSSEEDKPYDPEAHSGLGRKTLQLKDGSNILTQEDFSDANTIYIVQYDFDLNGETIEIPEGCILDFEGGSINNGKLVSNETIVLNTPRGNAFYGIYLDELRNPLSYNYKTIKDIKPSVEHGYTPTVTPVTGEVYDATRVSSRKRVPQGVAVFKYNNRKYFASFHVENDVNIGVFVFDEYYNLIKYVDFADGIRCHANDCTVRGDSILVSNCLDDVPGIRSISIQTLMTTASGGTISPENISLCSNKVVVAIDYDNTRHELAITISGGGLEIYDDNDNLISTTSLSSVSELLPKVTWQGMIYKNGQVVFLLWGTQLDNYTNSEGAVPVAFDAKTGKAYILPYRGVPFAQVEIEAVCKDPDNDSFYWTIYHIWPDGDSSTSRTPIVKHSFDTSFKGVSNYYTVGNGSLGDGTYVTAYVYSNGTTRDGINYIANGSPEYPFKTLDAAMLCMGYIGARMRYALRAGDYYIGSFAIASRFIHFIGMDGRDNTRVYGSFTLWGGHFKANGITFINDYDNRYTFQFGEFSDAFIDACKFEGTLDDGVPNRYCIYHYGLSQLRVRNTIINNYIIGVNSEVAEINLEQVTCTNCTTAIKVRKTKFHYAGPLTLTNCTTALDIDDEKIEAYLSSLTITNCENAIYKNVEYRRAWNFEHVVADLPSLNFIINFVRNGNVNNTCVQFVINNGNSNIKLRRGKYGYNGNGFYNLGTGQSAVRIINNETKIVNYYGTTAERPTTALLDADNADDIGFRYYDETLNKFICWNGSGWVNVDGSPLT